MEGVEWAPMAFSRNELAAFMRNRQSLTAPPGEARVLVIGSPDVWLRWKDCERYNIQGITKDMLTRMLAADTNEYRRLTKIFMRSFFNALGYSHYFEIDVQPRADFIIDLNQPVELHLYNQFDLIWDNGSIEHMMNINQVMRNTLNMVKIGGRIVHTQGIGDQTNAGYWTISPDLYLDYYNANHCDVHVIELTDRRGHSMSYTSPGKKTSTVGMLIPLRLLPVYYLRQMRADIIERMSRRSSKIRNCIRIPELLSSALKKRGLKSFSQVLRFLQHWVNIIVGHTSASGPSWGIFVVSRCYAKGETKYPLQGIYRNLASERYKSA